NSGRPFSRFLRPYMIGATVLILGSLAFNHFIIPKANKVRLAFEEKYYWRGMSVQDYYAEYPGEQVVYFSNYLTETNIAEDFVVQQFDEKGNLIYLLKAQTASNRLGSND